MNNKTPNAFAWIIVRVWDSRGTSITAYQHHTKPEQLVPWVCVCIEGTHYKCPRYSTTFFFFPFPLIFTYVQRFNHSLLRDFICILIIINSRNFWMCSYLLYSCHKWDDNLIVCNVSIKFVLWRNPLSEFNLWLVHFNVWKLEFLVFLRLVFCS